MLKRLFGKIRDLSFDQGELTIHWTNKKTSKLPLVWLRDNVETSQRQPLPLSMKLQRVTLDERKDSLTIKWVDREPDVYTSNWLETALFPTSENARFIKQEILLENHGKERLNPSEIIEEAGKTLFWDRFLRSGIAVFQRGKWGEQELLRRLFSSPGETIPSGSVGLHTEGPFFAYPPKVVCISAFSNVKIRLLDSLVIRNEESLASARSVFANVKTAFFCETPEYRYRAEHSFFGPDYLVFNDFWRDSSVRDRSFYAALGHFHEFLRSEKGVVSLTLGKGENLLIDNHRILHDRSPVSAEVTVFPFSIIQGRALKHGFSVLSQF